MPEDPIARFQQERQLLNDIVMKYAGLATRRFFSLDGQVYRPGRLPGRMKELMGLVASLVLRCDDCVTYHLIRCYEEQVSSEEVEEALAIGLVVGGSITIPHLRRAMRYWDELQQRTSSTGATPLPQNLAALLRTVATIVEWPGERRRKLQAISNLLKNQVEHYDWVGFYLVEEEPGLLVLGPFAGAPTEHVRIPFGKGVCGRAAAEQKTVVVQDVAKEQNYLACSVHVKSEIVVPLLKNGQVLGELDIDSHKLAAFDEHDRRFLEAVAELVVQAWD
ncbi:MAG: GAF domain-containing protein [bacterium]|jgi:GAF domain-containing protein|nr:GAF domain-containing protein [candidate division KSB1 bacterium]MDH7560529.1 GAF domain-containing protein [bacterium]